ncbi:hypothetical protein ONZ45_g4636 [Pleurotus djamor]|nr:hypothetical protein ONZ45_g4636 [Pleurotus djamor]
MPRSHLRFSTDSQLTITGRQPCPSYHSYMGGDMLLGHPTPENPDRLEPPPNYRPHSILPPSFEQAVSPPPHSPDATDSQDARISHQFFLDSKKITFTLLSRATSTQSQPLFLEGDNVQGSVILNLEKEESVQAIKVAVRGKLLTGSGAQTHVLTFLDVSNTIWDRLHPLHALNSASVSSMKDGKLTPGEYTFPFCFPFPSGGSITTPGCLASHLPHTFLEKGLNGNIQYDVEMRIVKGKFRTDLKIRTMVAHIPRIVAKRLPPLRRQAYLSNTSLLGPSDSPNEEWLTLEHVTIRGKVFNSRPAEVQCVLSLSNPYNVVLLPFDVIGFTPEAETPAASQSVEIVTDHPAGPRPRRYLPPAERKERRLKGRTKPGVSDDIDLMSNIGSFSGSFM